MFRRAFTEEFRTHSVLNNGWPHHQDFHEWCAEKNIECIKSGVYSELRDGGIGTYRQVGLVIQYLLDPMHTGIPERAALNSFLKNRYGPQPRFEDIVAEVSEECDPFTLRTLELIFNRFVNPLKFVRPFQVGKEKEEKDLRRAISWLFVESGRHWSTRKLTVSEAIQAGEDMIGQSLREYQELAISWSLAQPWSVVRSVFVNTTTGIAISIAVSDKVYEQMRAGERRIDRCPATDLVFPSRNILVQGLAMKHNDEPAKGAAKPSFTLKMAIVSQQCFLSRVPGICFDQPLRLLTFEGTPENTKRAMQLGYKRIDVRMPGTQLGLLERTLILDEKGEKDAKYMGIWRGLQARIDRTYGPARPLPPPA